MYQDEETVYLSYNEYMSSVHFVLGGSARCRTVFGGLRELS